MEDSIFWELAAKAIAGQASEREAQELQAMLVSNPGLRKLYDEAVDAWHRYPTEDLPRTNPLAAWTALEERIDRHEARATSPSALPVRGQRRRRTAADMESAARRHDIPAAPRRLRSSHNPAVRPRQPMGRHLIQAGVALFVVAFIAVVFWPKSSARIIATERGERIAIELADGSRVHLNVDSRLAFHEMSGEGPREVSLEGEAYFEVAPDEDRPFRIRTREGVIQVLGTAFNVDAYADRHDVTVAVAEGAVGLIVKGSAESTGTETVVLRPRELGVMADQRVQALQRNVDLESYLAWKKGRLVFSDAPFAEVVRRLERWYDLDIEVSSPDSIDRLNADIYRESASDVVRDIALALGLQYEHHGTRVRFFR